MYHRNGTLPVFLFLAASAVWAQAPPVPASYQDLYTQTTNYLNAFNTSLNSQWNGSTPSVLASGSLTNADANSGPQMINSGYEQGMLLQLQALKAVGVQAVTVEIGFPMLYKPFLDSQSQPYDQYVGFYQNVASLVRAAGLKLVVENDIMLATGTAGAGWDSSAFLAGLSWAQYQQARAQTAAVIAQTLRPDYLVLSEEPDTEAANSGQATVQTPTGSVSMVSQMITSVQKTGVPGIQLGAGVGVWLSSFQDYISAYVTLPLNFIDMHIYAVNGNDLPNAFVIASIAASAGMPVSMTECWLHKIRDSELGLLTQDQIRARDAFSFWSPLDSYFLQLMQNFAHFSGMSFLNVFGTPYFWAYLPYETVKTMAPADVMDMETQQAGLANQQANFTSTAQSFHDALVIPADTIPPSTPSGVSGVSGNPNAAVVSWTASTDNVGTAGYNIFRNGLLVGTTAQTFYKDVGLAEATTYSYAVQAFDLAGNSSPFSQPAPVTTKNVTPPTVPGHLTATALSSFKVQLSWGASSDKEGVTSYQVFWGNDPADLSQIGVTYGTTTSYTSKNLNPATTYYYAVQAKDKSGNYSNMSATVAVTTVTPPPQPAGLMAIAKSSTRIGLSWFAVASQLPVKYYHVFAGFSPTSMTQVAVVSGPSYTGSSLNPATTYYYAVQAADSAGDLSVLSEVVAVTTLALPSPPAHIASTEISSTAIELSWSAAIGPMPIAYYRIYGSGSAPNSVTGLIGQTGSLSYTIRSLTPGTTYYYVLAAVDAAGDVSPYSPPVAASTPAVPLPPASLTATAVSASQVQVSWPAASSQLPIANYRVLGGTSRSTSSMSQLGVVRSGLSFTNRNLTAGTTYYYAVEAVDTGGDVSAASVVASATTLGQ